MKELNKTIRKLELELKLLHSSKAALLKERRKKKISREDYKFHKQIREDSETKTKYRKEIEQRLANAKDKQREERQQSRYREERSPGLALTAIIVMLLSLTIISNYEGITGALTFTKEQTITEVINNSFTDNTVLELNLTNITSLRISGEIIGRGRAKVLLDINGTFFTVMDEFTTTKEPTNLITGLVIAEESYIAENTTPENITIEENSSTIENLTINSTENITIEDVTVEENITKETNITIDVIENITDETNATINVTENITSEINISKENNISINVTENTTNKVNITKSKIINISKTNITENISEDINITINVTTNITTKINKTTNVTKNITIKENITITTNITESEILNISDTNITESKIINISDNNITPEINITENITEVFTFTNECLETCLLEIPSGKLIIELENVELKIDSITYNKEVENKPPVQTRKIENLTFYNEYTVNASQYFKDSEGDKLIFDVKEMIAIETTITKNLITFRTNKTGIYDTFLYATDGYSLVKSNVFSLKVGTEIVENITINKTSTIEENITQLPTVIGQPVKWRKVVKIEESVEETTIKIPEEAVNIKVTEEETSKEIVKEKLSIVENKTRKKLEQYETEKEIKKVSKQITKEKKTAKVKELETKLETLETKRTSLITGAVIAEPTESGIITKLLDKLVEYIRTAEITGRVVQEVPKAVIENETINSSETIEESETQEINITVKENITINIIENITEEINTTINVTENTTNKVNITKSKIINISKTNITENISEDINITINVTTNITTKINKTTNVTKNITIKENITITTNISENITTNITESKIINISDNNITPEINITENITTEENKIINETPKIKVTENITEEIIIPENVTKKPIIIPEVLNISENTTEKVIDLIIEDNATSYIIEYETEAPELIEEEISKYRKRVTVTANLHYERILTFTNITPSPKENIALYWIRNGTKTRFNNVTLIDTDNDGLIDKLEWITPHLSNQTFEISITVLNVQSYPMVGGFWTVKLNTTGTADLEVIPYNLTTFVNKPIPIYDGEDDLEFEELLCGNYNITELWTSTDEQCENSKLTIDNSTYCYIEDNKTFINYTELLTTNLSINITSLKIYDYNCTNISYWTDTVRTPGAHHILFTFGASNATAHNWAVKNATSTTENATVSIRRPSSAMTSIQGAYMLLNNTETNTETQHDTTWTYNYSTDCQEEGNYEVYVELMSLGNSGSEKDTTGIAEVITYWVDNCIITGTGKMNCTVHAKSKNTNADEEFGGRLELSSNCYISNVTGDADQYHTSDGQDLCSDPCGTWIEFYHNVGTSDNTDETTFNISCDDGTNNNAEINMTINETCGPSTCAAATRALGGFDACADPTCTDGFTYIGDDTVENLGGFDLMKYDIGILDAWGWSTVSTYDITWDSIQRDCDCYLGAGYWNLGGETAAADCCGDDGSENRITETGSTDVPGGFNDGGTSCCSASTDCTNDDTCSATTETSGSIPNKAYCSAATWYGGDYSEAACTAITGGANWNLGGETAATDCCGDDNSENKDISTYDTSMDNTADGTDACCLASTDCVDADTCYDTGSVSQDADSDGDNDYCNAGTWYDCSTDSECGTGYFCNSNDCLPSQLDVIFEEPTPAHDSRQINNIVNINVSVNSLGSNIDSCILEWNGANESVTIIGSGTNVTCNITKTTTDGTIYTYKVFANNTVGTWGNTSFRNFTENTKPPAPTHSTPADNSTLFGNSQTITWSAGGSDAEGDTITYYWFIDTDNPPSGAYTCDGSTTGTTSSACATVDGTTYYWNIIAGDTYENQTATSTWNFTENTKPAIDSQTVTPVSPVTSDDLTCTYTISDSENTTLYVYYKWYNGTNLVQNSGKSAISSVEDSVILGSGNTSKGETWYCEITPYDGFENGTSQNASVTILNSNPSITLTAPANNTPLQQYSNRTPEFTWTSNDDDSDSLNYTIWIAEDSSFSTINITSYTDNLLYISSSDLGVDMVYWWRVEVFDDDTRINSTTWNFTIDSYKAISLTTSTVDFGNMAPNDVKDTENDVSPFIIENIGNLVVNLTIYANTTLWTNADINTSYYMYRADVSEAGAFDSGTSQITWANMSNASSNLMKIFDFHVTTDEAQIDINLTAPDKEPPEQKNSTIVVTAQ